MVAIRIAVTSSSRAAITSTSVPNSAIRLSASSVILFLRRLVGTVDGKARTGAGQGINPAPRSDAHSPIFPKKKEAAMARFLRLMASLEDHWLGDVLGVNGSGLCPVGLFPWVRLGVLMDDAPLRPSEMIAAVRSHAAHARFEDLRGSQIMEAAATLQDQNGLVDEERRSKRLVQMWDRADAAWGVMEQNLNVLIPLLVSPEFDMILARLQAAFEAEGQ